MKYFESMKCYKIQSGVTANLQYNIRQIFKCKNISKKAHYYYWLYILEIEQVEG